MPRRLPSSKNLSDYIKSHEGKSVDIVKLLTTKSRDYLVRENGERVKVTELMNKIVALFVDDCESETSDFNLRIAFQEAYKHLDKGCFEAVHVATKWNDIFHKKFYGMPWLAIPENDAKSRRLMVAKYREPFPTSSSCLLIDADGKVLDPVAGASFLFENFGAYWYPFTVGRIKEITHETNELHQKLYERSHLVSQDGKYGFDEYSEKIPLSVIAEKSSFFTNFFSYGTYDFFLHEGKEVPISVLEGKVVGVYFYLNEDHVHPRREELEAKLVEALAVKKSEFALLLIPLHFDVHIEVSKQQKSNKVFENLENMSVFSLPLMDPRVRRVTQFFNICGQRCITPIVVIIGPQGKYVDYHGADIILDYGVKAYPFTRSKVLELEMSRLNGLTHVSLLQEKTLYRGKQQITDICSELKEKIVVMFIGGHDSYDEEGLYTKLRQFYLSRRKEDRLEVVYVPFNYAKGVDYCREMPWIVVYPRKRFILRRVATLGDELEELLNNLVKNHLLDPYICPPEVIVFGRDGRVITRKGKDYLSTRTMFDACLFDDLVSVNLHDEIANCIIEKYDLNRDSNVYGWYCIRQESE